MLTAYQKGVETRRRKWQARVDEQRKWIAEHGGDLAGYVLRYGAVGDPNMYGAGGEAIYEADKAALDKYERRLAKLG